MSQRIFWKVSDKFINSTNLLIIVFILNENRYTLKVLQKGVKLYKIQDRKVFVNSNHNSSLDK